MSNQSTLFTNVPINPEIKEDSKYIRPAQSANVLFKFMTQLDYLKQIIEKKAILPRYNEEIIDYLEIGFLNKIAIPMSCFCDIHLNKLKPHMKEYGTYGIGLNKKWGIEQGIQPVHYINKKSHLRNDFSSIFLDVFKMSEKERTTYKNYNNYLLMNLLYMKPVDGKMNKNGVDKDCNFHDEKEWRFIPSFKDISTDLPEVIIEKEQMHPKSYNTYSNGILKRPELWLNIDLKEIKYFIVETVQDRKELIQFINEQEDIEVEDRYMLISKILVVHELMEDW